MTGDYHKMKEHVGHDIECVMYGDGDNVALQCVTCSEIIYDADKPEVPDGCLVVYEDEILTK